MRITEETIKRKFYGLFESMSSPEKQSAIIDALSAINAATMARWKRNGPLLTPPIGEQPDGTLAVER